MAILMKYPFCITVERFEPAADVTSKFLNGFLSSVSPFPFHTTIQLKEKT